MMKKFKLFTFLVIFMSTLIITISSYAADKATLTLEKGTTSVAKIMLKVEGITFKANSNYSVYANNSNVKPSESIGYLSEGKINISSVYEKAGDIYIWIDEYTDGTTNTLVNAQKVERISQNSLENRINGSFFGNTGSSIFIKEPYTGEKNVKVKLGVIDDNNILQAIKNNRSKGLQQLLTYAKKANALKEEKLSTDSSKNTSPFLLGLNLNKNTSYFVYYQLDDENCTYYPIEDVGIYSYAYYSSNEGQLIDWNSDLAVSNSGNNIPIGTDSKEKDDTIANQKLPDTGTLSIIFILIITISTTIIFAYKNKKYHNIK